MFFSFKPRLKGLFIFLFLVPQVFILDFLVFFGTILMQVLFGIGFFNRWNFLPMRLIQIFFFLWLLFVFLFFDINFGCFGAFSLRGYLRYHQVIFWLLIVLPTWGLKVLNLIFLDFLKYFIDSSIREVFLVERFFIWAY